MKTFNRRILALVVAFLVCGACYAGESAVVITYQPIITESEKPSKGFSILPIPFLWHHVQGHPPYFAATLPNQILTDAPRSVLLGDRNLLSSAGVIIAGAFDDDTVYVRFENLRLPSLAAEDLTDDDIAEAALECIRRIAHDTKTRPKLIISGKAGQEAKWKKWRIHFEQHDLAKPFNRPNA